MCDEVKEVSKEQQDYDEEKWNSPCEDGDECNGWTCECSFRTR